jgi:hypothetical protein
LATVKSKPEIKALQRGDDGILADAAAEVFDRSGRPKKLMMRGLLMRCLDFYSA